MENRRGCSRPSSVASGGRCHATQTSTASCNATQTDFDTDYSYLSLLSASHTPDALRHNSDTNGGGGRTPNNNNNNNSPNWLRLKEPETAGGNSIVTADDDIGAQTACGGDSTASPLTASRGHALSATTTTAEPSEVDQRQRQYLILMRHGETMNTVFPTWLQHAYQTGNAYRQYDLNQPRRMIGRPREHFVDDGPLTQTGMLTAQMIGRGLRMTHAPPDYVYSSPALSCLQTAHHLLKGLGNNTSAGNDDADGGRRVRMRVEPGLFEPLQWYETSPLFVAPQAVLTADELDAAYTPVVSQMELNRRLQRHETVADGRKRIATSVLAVVDRKSAKTTEEDGASESPPLSQRRRIVVVGHATTIDATLAALVDDERVARPTADELHRCYPFSTTVVLGERTTLTTAADNERGRWRLKREALPPATRIDADNHYELTTTKKFDREAVVAATNKA